MNNDKIQIRFKKSPSDFIVEEFYKDKICEVSKTLDVFTNPKVQIQDYSKEDLRAFLTFDLEKLNVDQFSAFSALQNQLSKRDYEIGYAGTKDKLAWTCQRISVFSPDLDKIKNFSFPGIVLKNFKWAKHKINIGNLDGNRFKITLREADKEVLNNLPIIRRAQFIPNYFGVQRFGSLRQDNFKIGKLIFKKKFEEAVQMFLTGYGENEDKEVKDAKKSYKQTKNLDKAQKDFPKKLKIEHIIINHLLKNPKDWLGALRQIDEKIVLIIAQSVQSKLFNDILEKSLENKIELKNKMLSLPGYDSKPSEGKIGRIEEEVLEEHGLTYQDFFLKEIPFLSVKSSARKALFEVKDLDIYVENDEIFQGSKKIILKFKLGPGEYATTFLENYFDLI